jgi:hypothetical protein
LTPRDLKEPTLPVKSFFASQRQNPLTEKNFTLPTGIGREQPPPRAAKFPEITEIIDAFWGKFAIF